MRRQSFTGLAGRESERYLRAAKHRQALRSIELPTPGCIGERLVSSSSRELAGEGLLLVVQRFAYSGGSTSATVATLLSSASDGCPRAGSASAMTTSEPSKRDL